MTAHNLANASTAGYKAMHPLFESVKDPSTEQDVSYVQDRGAYLELSHGALQPTGNPLDIALAGEGWFAFQLEGGETGYSRHGKLVVDVDGQLKTSTGSVLLDAGGGPIALPEGAGQDVTITSSGTISDNSGAVLGTIGVFAIAGADKLQSSGGGMYLLPAGFEAPQPKNDPQIRQGFIESSNVEAVLEMTRLIDIQRAYENSIKLMNQDDDLTKTAIQRLGRSS